MKNKWNICYATGGRPVKSVQCSLNPKFAVSLTRYKIVQKAVEGVFNDKVLEDGSDADDNLSSKEDIGDDLFRIMVFGRI